MVFEMKIISALKEYYAEIKDSVNGDKVAFAKIDEVLKNKIDDAYIGETVQSAKYNHFVIRDCDKFINEVVADITENVIRMANLGGKMSDTVYLYLNDELLGRVQNYVYPEK